MVSGLPSWLTLTPGCISMPERNTGLGATAETCAAAAKEMARDHKPLARHVIILNGYRGLPTAASRRARHLAALTSGNRADFLAISYTFDTDIDRITREVIDGVQETWPSDDPAQTVEVDVVAISMGGLIARWAALPPEQRIREGAPAPASPPAGRRLRIANLYTLGTPHRGAILADTFTPDPAARDMAAGSGFLRTLDAHLSGAGYSMVCYAQLRDGIAGATRCAPPGSNPIWTSGTFLASHFRVYDNSLFEADIARRLRREPSLLHQAGPPPRN